MDSLPYTAHSMDAVLGHSILHLLENKETTIADCYQILKPGGVFITSTACIGDHMRYLQPLLSIGHFLRLLPRVLAFTTDQLERSILDAVFSIEYQWTPGKGKAVFIVARKPR